MSVQHRDWIALPDLRDQLFEHVVAPTLGDIDPGLCKLNHKGSFVEGGADADCGLTGRKIVVDAYGPSCPVGGGAFSGKDPTKVDRAAAYAARQMALTVLDQHPAGGTVCDVAIAYGIGQHQPEILTAIIDGVHDVSDWLTQRFPDNSPAAIQERLGLWDREGWRYADTASFGHFGRDLFPWEHPLPA
jgi:S-adenosylmethionine synthetase